MDTFPSKHGIMTAKGNAGGTQHFKNCDEFANKGICKRVQKKGGRMQFLLGKKNESKRHGAFQRF